LGEGEVEKAVNHPVYSNNFPASTEFFDDFSFSIKKIEYFGAITFGILDFGILDVRCFEFGKISAVF